MHNTYSKRVVGKSRVGIGLNQYKKRRLRMGLQRSNKDESIDYLSSVMVSWYTTRKKKDGWMDKWMDGWINGWMNGWTDYYLSKDERCSVYLHESYDTDKHHKELTSRGRGRDVGHGGSCLWNNDQTHLYINSRAGQRRAEMGRAGQGSAEKGEVHKRGALYYHR